MRQSWGVTLALSLLTITPVSGWSQAAVDFQGEVQTLGLFSRQRGHWVAQNQVDRLQVEASGFGFTATAGFLWNPIGGFNELDATNVAYDGNRWSAKVGRFMPIVGQSTWYDQWNTGFVFLPNIESEAWFDNVWLWQTDPGALFSFSFGKSNVTLEGLDSNDPVGQVLPQRIDRFAGRLETTVANTVLGAGWYFDPSRPQDHDRAFLVDFRSSFDHFIVRGEGMVANTEYGDFRGGFVDGYYRPRGQEKLTLVGRIQGFETVGGYEPQKTWTYTLGAKYLLPLNFVLSLNYNFGGSFTYLSASPGWALGLQRTFTF